MFRDADEALRRLEKELLAEEDRQEETQKLPFEEELLTETSQDTDEDLVTEYDADPFDADSDIKIYNADDLDTDVEEFARQVREPEKENNTGLLALIFILLCAILLVLGVFVLRMGGYL